MRSRGARSEQAEQHQRDRGDKRRQGGQGPQPRETCGRQHRALAHGCDRRHARGAQGGAQRGQQRYEHPHDQRHSHRARGENRARVRQIDAEGDQQRVEPLRQREAEQEPDQRGEQADCERFQQHRPQHLAPRRAERAQRRKLARALSDGDRERVGDHEAADEQGDPAEGEQEVPEDVEEPVRVVGLLLCLRLAGANPRAGWKQRPDLAYELQRACSRPAGDLDRVEAVLLGEDGLRRRCREDRDRRPAERGDAAEPNRPGDREVLHRPARHDADALAHREFVFAGRSRVDRDLAGTAGPIAARQRERVETFPLRVVAECQRRSAAPGDHLAVVPDQLRVIGDPAGALGDSRQRAHLVQ